MIAGVVFSVLASLAMNLGNLVEKRAVDDLPPLSGRRIVRLARMLLTSRLWLLGFVVCLVGLGFQVVAFASAPIAVVQSIFNAGIVLLVVASRVHLRERLSKAEVLGLSVVIASVVVIASTLGRTRRVGTGGSGVDVLLASVPTLVGIAVVLWLIRSRRGGSGFLFGVGAGLLYGIASLATKGASTLVIKDGVVGSLPHLFASSYPYLFAVFSVFALILYQTGIQRSRFSVVGAMSDAVASTYVVGVGAVVFGEALPASSVAAILRFGGFAGVVIGSVVVAMGGKGEVKGVSSSSTAEEDYQPRRSRRRRPAHAAPRRSFVRPGGQSR